MSRRPPPPPAVIDTNVVVAGLLTGDPGSPTARILAGMLVPDFVFLLSVPLLAEYRDVLLRPRIRERHDLTEDEVDPLLEEITLVAAVREPAPGGSTAPDPGDQHLWDLLAAEPRAVLVTGDRELVEASPTAGRIVSPSDFAMAIDR